VTAAREVWVQWSVVLVNLVKITTGGISLPDFDECMRHGAAVFVQHTATDDNALAQRFAMVLTREVARFHIHHG
jgi:hypothetical protein